MISELENHLWQSTLFACVVGLLTLVLRRNRAAVRHALWLTASVKFLVPFSLLIGIGSQVEWRKAPVVQPQVSFVMEEISHPFALPTPAPLVPAPKAPSRVPVVLCSLWLCGFAANGLAWWRRWRRVRAALRAASPLPLNLPIPVMSTPARLEPGVFGIRKPVLLLPDGIADRLTPAQLQAILAHELCHVRRRDNLAAAVHMLVEALFWFHPLVWWIQARLVEERERACDEEVLRMVGDPQDYAEGILNVCKFYLESPLVCVSGVAGSNLKRRVEAIMMGCDACALNFGRKLLLTVAGILAVTAPLMVGVLNAPLIRGQAQSTVGLAFDVASVKLHAPGDRARTSIGLVGGRFLSNGPLLMAIPFAYGIPFNARLLERLTGLPDWAGLSGDVYDIEATATFPAGLPQKAREDRARLMLQALLADRFKLKVHTVSKEIPVYALVVGKGGPKLQKADIEEKDCPEGPPPPLVVGAPVTTCHVFNGGRGRGLHARAADMSDLVTFVSSWTDRPLLDKTGIEGLYNFDTTGWLPMDLGPPAAPGTKQDGVDVADIPTIFELFEKLGLKMESTKDKVDVYVVDHIEKPADN